jgi:hypothetical protein
MEIQLYESLLSTLMGCQWSTSRIVLFIQGNSPQYSLNRMLGGSLTELLWLLLYSAIVECHKREICGENFVYIKCLVITDYSKYSS